MYIQVVLFKFDLECLKRYSKTKSKQTGKAMYARFNISIYRIFVISLLCFNSPLVFTQNKGNVKQWGGLLIGTDSHRGLLNVNQAPVMALPWDMIFWSPENNGLGLAITSEQSKVVAYIPKNGDSIRSNFRSHFVLTLSKVLTSISVFQKLFCADRLFNSEVSDFPDKNRGGRSG